MKTYDVVVIGGSAAGIVAAATVRQTYPDKKVAVIRREKKVLVPCGIPYTVKTVGDVDKNIIADEAVTGKGADLIIDEVMEILVDEKKLLLRSGEEVAYDKLILATGSKPVFPPIPGRDLDGVFTVPKDYDTIKELKARIEKAENVVVVGGGFIGVEFSDEISSLGKKVTIVEMLPHVLGKAFDPEFAAMAEDVLKEKGVSIKTGELVTEIAGEDGKVKEVVLKSGERIPADLVILSIGYRPNSDLAKKAGIPVGTFGGIIVDNLGKTLVKDIYAVGDCAENRCSLTPNGLCPMLASVATATARRAALNLYRVKALPTAAFGAFGFSTVVGGRTFAAVGLTEQAARDLGYDIIVGKFETLDTHPGSVPGSMKQIVKLIALAKTGHIIGAQLTGGKSVGELVNVIATAVTAGMNASELAFTQVATHPLLTAAPTVYPISMAAMSILHKM